MSPRFPRVVSSLPPNVSLERCSGNGLRGARAVLAASRERKQNLFTNPRSLGRIPLLFVTICFWLALGCAAFPAVAQEEPDHSGSASKQVMALQAFLPDKSAEAIRTACLKVAAIPGSEVAFQWGAAPHVTLSAWRVTADEKVAALARFQKAPLNALMPIAISCQLTSREEGDSMSWYLVPTEVSRTAIDDFRRRAMATLDFEYEDFSGRSHENWWPHLTLFSVPLSQISEAQPVLAELETVQEIRFSKIALVGFESGIQTLSARELEHVAH